MILTRRKFLIGTAASLVVPRRALTQAIPWPGPGFISAGGAAYVGPGDVVSGALGWWGLRAYTAAIAAGGTQTIVNLRRDSDNGTVDILVASNGGLGLTANGSIGGTNGLTISAFKGSANLFVTKLYDQTGNAHDMVQATAANQPPFQLSILGSLPAIQFVPASSTVLRTASATWLTQAQPYTNSMVAYNTAGNGQFAFCDDGAPNIQLGLQSSNLWRMYAGNVLTASAANATWHAAQALYNGGPTSSNLYIDGTSNTGDAGTVGYATDDVAMGGSQGGGGGWEGYINECGIWAGNKSASFSSMNSNQHTYWGF